MSDIANASPMSNYDAKFEAQKIVFGPIMFQAARVLRDTGILKLLRQNHQTGLDCQAIAAQLKMSLYSVKVLLEAGLAMGVVSCEAAKYFITKTGFFLIADEMTEINLNFVNDVCYNGMFHLDEAIASGKPEGLKVFGSWDTIYQALSQLPEQVRKSWFAFDHFYSDGSFSEALPIVFKDNPQKLLDIGGNTGKWAVQCARHSEQVMVSLLDLPGQLEMAQKYIAQEKLSSRITGYEADILDPSTIIPAGFDVIWMSQFLDCFSEDEIVIILNKVRKSMHENAAIYIMETFWDRQAYDAAQFCLIGTSLYFTALANGCSKMYHSRDMIKCINQAGLEITEDYDRIGLSHTILKCKLAKDS
jgi:hypothetical protein